MAYLSPLHGISQVVGGDVPAAEDDVFRLDHGQQRLEGGENLLALVVTKSQRGSLCEAAKVVGLLQAILGHPCVTAAGQVGTVRGD